MPHWIRLCLLLVAIGNSPLLLAEAPYQPNPGTIRLSLPPIVPAVVGRECNIYFDNVVLVPNPANVIFDVNCLRGAQLADHWTWVPPAADVGDVQLQLDVRDAENRLIATGRTILRIVPANQGEGKALTVLCVGDSLTHSSQYTQRLLDRSAEPGNPHITLMCSHFVLTLAARRGSNFNVRRDLNSVVGLAGRHLVWPAPALRRLRCRANSSNWKRRCMSMQKIWNLSKRQPCEINWRKSSNWPL